VRYLGEADSVVWLSKDGSREVAADLAGIDVEGSHELDVADVIAAEVDVHQAGHELVGRSVSVLVDTLDEGGSAVADADNGDTNGTLGGQTHATSLPWQALSGNRLPPGPRLRRDILDTAMPLLRLAEIVLLVADLDRSVAFYRDVLGMTVISPVGAPATFLRVGPQTPGVPQQIVLVPRPRDTHLAATGKFDRDLHHIGLEVAPQQFEAERARLAVQGLPIRGGQHPFLQVQAFYLDDPDGNEIEIVSTTG
jgi:catechol 2,3-dioxygenase